MQHTTFSPAPEYLVKLQQAIRQAHGCDSQHEATWMGVEHVGCRMWSGSVEVFRLGEDAPATKAFAWSKVEGGQLHCFIVLSTPEIQSPRTAVRRFLELAEENDLVPATA